MKVEVDQLKCTTAGMCVMKCPEVFRFQEGSKKATVLHEIIPPRFESRCLEAAKSCPNGAIQIRFEP